MYRGGKLGNSGYFSDEGWTQKWCEVVVSRMLTVNAGWEEMSIGGGLPMSTPLILEDDVARLQKRWWKCSLKS